MRSYKSIFLLIIPILLGLSACSSNEKYQSCVEKGIQYYKDIGAYPNLKTENISAEAKVNATCKNSVVAFD